MLSKSRRAIPLVALTVFLIAAVPAFSSTQSGSLAGTWSGHIYGTGFARHRIIIRINSRQNGGHWQISSSCYGPERLDSISNGYHHFLRKLGRGAHCGLAGDIDCLKRSGANVYDAVTTHSGGAYDVHGTLRRMLTP